MLKTALAQNAREIDAAFDDSLPKFGELSLAIRHGVLAGGKRIRGFLVRETARICEVDAAFAMQGALAVEAIHAYSLVHDDLPAMDDDDLRRGQPTIHVKWDEATAILAGDALQALGFDYLTSTDFSPKAVIALTRSLAKSAGAPGMVGGQFDDLAAENNPHLGLDDIRQIHALKTGALINWSCQFGAVAAGRDLRPFEVFGQAIGRAFQIWDDVLDVESDAVTLGKTPGKDVDAGKSTYVSILGLDGAKKEARAEVDAAKTAISCIGDGSESLQNLAEFIITRSS